LLKYAGGERGKKANAGLEVLGLGISSVSKKKGKWKGVRIGGERDSGEEQP